MVRGPHRVFLLPSQIALVFKSQTVSQTRVGVLPPLPNHGMGGRRWRLPAALLLKCFGQNAIGNDDCRVEDPQLDLFVDGHDLSAVSAHDEEWEKYRKDATAKKGEKIPSQLPSVD